MRKDQYRLMYQLEDIHWWFLAKREFIKASLGEKTDQFPKILDLGCGTGGITKYLGLWGKPIGVEHHLDALPFLKKRKVTFTSCRIENFGYRKNSYDLICLFDVLYHKDIRSDVKVINLAYQALKPGGIILITDSALPFLFSLHDKVMHARERYYLDTLVQRVSSTGFIIEKSSYIYFFLFPLFLVSRFVNKFIPFPNVRKTNPFLNQLLLKICQLEAKLFKYISFPIGSSIIIKARKPKE